MPLNKVRQRSWWVGKLGLFFWMGLTNSTAQNRLQHTSLPALPALQGKPNPGVAGAFAGRSNGVLLVAGGANFPSGYPWQGGTKVWHSTVYALTERAVRHQGEPRTSGWQTVQPMGRPVGYGASATWRERVICVGGNDATRHYAEVVTLTWDPAASQLQTDSLPHLPVALANLAAAVTDNTLYVFGGESDRGTEKSLYALSLLHPASGWQKLAELPGPARAFTALVAVKEQLYVMGGRQTVAGKTTVYADTYLYQIAQNRWDRLSDMPTPLAAHGAVAAPDDAIWVIGGDTGERLKQIEQLNSQIAGQPAGPGRDSLTGRRNALQRDHPGFSRIVWAYQLKTRRWTKWDELTFAVPVTTAVVAIPGGFILPSGEVTPGVRTPACWQVTE